MKSVSIGTSGFTYNDWKGRFYPKELPQDKWLSFYSQNFETVEINASFYNSISKDTYTKWYKNTPAKFSFFIKGHRFITQIKRLINIQDSLDYFFDSVFFLKEKLEGVLWQFPPTFKLTEMTIERLKLFLSILPIRCKYAFEFRDESWFVQDAINLLKQYNAALVIADSDIYPVSYEVTASFIYVRFHGHDDLYSSLYSDQEVKTWSKKIKTWRKKYEVYCYFNNDINANAIKNARQLKNFLQI